MKRLLVLASVTVSMLAPTGMRAQSAETQREMTVPQFRQVLADLGSFLDLHRGTDLRRQFEGLSDDSVKLLYSAVPNPLRLQSAVAALKQQDAAPGHFTARLNPGGPSFQPNAVFPACSPNTIIDNSPGAQCTPPYPDPNSGDWQAMVNPLITFGAFSPTDYPHVSSQACGLKVETNLQQVTVAFQGALNTLTPVCSAIPSPFNAACWGPLAAVAATESVSAGLFSDCVEQDGLVNAAEIDAGFHNTVTIYNTLKAVDTHLTNVNNQITNEFSALDTHLTNVDTHVTAEFNALDAHLVALFTALTNQLSQSTALLGADLKQVMKLELTPEGLRAINPAILACTGTNCPNVLAACPTGGCSWNRVGPLP